MSARPQKITFAEMRSLRAVLVYESLSHSADYLILLQFALFADSRIAEGAAGMSFHELRVGVGLLLAVAFIIGWSLGIGLPVAAVIIWLLD
jgi:hypothetical protein